MGKYSCPCLRRSTRARVLAHATQRISVGPLHLATIVCTFLHSPATIPAPQFGGRLSLRSCICALFLIASPAFAADHFLTFGGGDSASHNQVSLEKNVLYLQRVLNELGVSPASHDIYFSDGTDP